MHAEFYHNIYLCYVHKGISLCVKFKILSGTFFGFEGFKLVNLKKNLWLPLIEPIEPIEPLKDRWFLFLETF